MVDIAGNVCDNDVITVPVSSKGGADAGLFVNDDTQLIKFGHGGKRSGAGRKPNPTLPTQISYTPDQPRWYCVRTDYGAETTVDVAMRKAGFQTLYPLMWVPPVAARRTEAGRAIPATSERLVPLLPRYLLVRFDRSNPSWRRICTMRGVERIFSTHPERPTPIPDGDVTELTRDLAPNGVLYPPAVPERATAAKRRWVDMATALIAIQTEAV